MQQLANKTVIVTGGTGFIGRALCRALTAQGARVIVVSRRKHASTSAVTYVNSFADIAPVGVDIIINLAGEPISQRWTTAVKTKILQSRIKTTDAVVDYIARATQKPALLISGSAIGYYGTSEQLVFNEDSPAQATQLFSSQLCREWESRAWPATHHGVRTVLLRLGVVLEKDGGVLQKLLLPFKCGLGGNIGSGRQWLSWIDRDDLIKLIFFIIARDDIEGAVNATAPSPVRNSDFTAVLARTLRRPAVLPVPAPVLKTIYGEMADEIMLQGQKVLPDRIIAKGFVFDYPLLENALQKILR